MQGRNLVLEASENAKQSRFKDSMIPHVDSSCVAPCIATPATPADLIDLSLRQIRLIATTSKERSLIDSKLEKQI